MAQKNIILTNGNITETTYNDEKIDGLVLFENIKDRNGNNRFIEGNITPETISGANFTQHKWSLSGTHLMFVLAGSATAAISAGTKLATISNLPTYIIDKIYRLLGSVSTIVTINNMISRQADGTALVEYKCELDKISNSQLEIYCQENINPNNYTVGVRLQFDLLIDNE